MKKRDRETITFELVLDKKDFEELRGYMEEYLEEDMKEEEIIRELLFCDDLDLRCTVRVKKV